MDPSQHTPAATDKLNMQTQDCAAEKLRRFRELFPNAVTEGMDANGNPVPVIDREVLMKETGIPVLKEREWRYQFTWPDKDRAYFAANAPTDKCLRPCRGESVHFDSTENLYIEGDNLEVLKILRESYLGKVKMIYIDPPYNTGNDFVYRDNFSINAENYRNNSGQLDALGNRLVANTESNGRFHTDWLNMMYPRLKVARDLLAVDGVIFISIDDNEQANLKKVCDEIFGEDNFVTTLHCQMSTTQGMKVKAAQNGNIVKNAEYIICYSKNGKKNIAKNPLYDLRPEYDTHYNLFLKEDGSICNIIELYDFRFPKDCSNKKPFKIQEAYKRSEEFAEIVRTHLAEIVRTDKVTGFELSNELKNGYWKRVVRNGKEYLLTLDRNNSIRQLLRLKDSWGKTDGFYEVEGLRKIRGDWWDGFYIDMGNVSKEGDIDFKNGKKPIRLIKQIVKMVCDPDSLILDFFSGSATTAHAVMQLNAEDGGNRKFIMVQLPESCDEKSEAYKAGYKNICEIGKERIRRAGTKIIEKKNEGDTSLLTPQSSSPVDIGFRVLKLSESNMRENYYKPEEVVKNRELFQEETIKEGRTAEDLLFQIMPELDIPLSASLEEIELDACRGWSVADGYLIAVLDGELTEDCMRAIAEKKPYHFVTKESTLGKDERIANLHQILNPDGGKDVRIHIL